MVKAKTRVIEFRNELSELKRLEEETAVLASDFGLSAELVFEINLALDELLTNVISYAFEDDGEHVIRLTIEREDDDLVFTLIDDGAPFDPLSSEKPDTEGSLEERKIGGLGLYFVRKKMDAFSYRREASQNMITLRKRVLWCQGNPESKSGIAAKDQSVSLRPDVEP